MEYADFVQPVLSCTGTLCQVKDVKLISILHSSLSLDLDLQDLVGTSWRLVRSPMRSSDPGW